jgi:hypothetical protein
MSKLITSMTNTSEIFADPSKLSQWEKIGFYTPARRGKPHPPG